MCAKEHRITELPVRGGGGDKLHRANSHINKSEAASADDRPNSKYLMCLCHYSVSVKASEGATVTVSAVLAGGSMALRRNSEGIHKRGAFLLTCTSRSRHYQR